MPPKKAEITVVIEAPEHVSLNENLVAQAMQLCIKGSGSSSSSNTNALQQQQQQLEELLAKARGVSDSYTVVSRDRDTVDFAVECITFAAAAPSSSMTPRKALRFFNLMFDLRECIHRGDVAAAKAQLKNFAVSEVTAYDRESVIQAAIAEQLASAEANMNASPQPGSRRGGGGGGGDGGGERGERSSSKKQKDGGDGGSPSAALASQHQLPPHQLHFSTADIGSVVDFASFGLLQNWALYYGAYTNNNSCFTSSISNCSNNNNNNVVATSSSSCSCAGAGMTVTPVIFAPIVPPAGPPPLHCSKSLADWEAAEAARREAIAAELRHLQNDEREALEQEAREAAARAAAEERQQQEEEAARLFFERHGTDLAVQHVQKELQQDISSRHAALIARIVKLEELYRVGGTATAGTS